MVDNIDPGLDRVRGRCPGEYVLGKLDPVRPGLAGLSDLMD